MNHAHGNDDGLMREEALLALRDAAAGVIAEHKRLGMPLIVWRDGKVMQISPDEAESEYKAEKAKHEAEQKLRSEQKVSVPR